MITKDMTIMEAIEQSPEAAGVFQGFGMHCLGCAIAHGETVEQAAQVHGIELDVMLAELNKATAN